MTFDLSRARMYLAERCGVPMGNWGAFWTPNAVPTHTHTHTHTRTHRCTHEHISNALFILSVADDDAKLCEGLCEVAEGLCWIAMRFILHTSYFSWPRNGLISVTFTFTFSHLADAFVQSDVQGREQSS